MNNKNMPIIILWLLLYSCTVFSMISDDIEIGPNLCKYHRVIEIKKSFYKASAWLLPTAGTFISEICMFHAIQQTSDFFGDDDLPLLLYVVASCTSSLVGCVLCPRVYSILRNNGS